MVNIKAWLMKFTAIVAICRFRREVISPLRELWEDIQFLGQVWNKVWDVVWQKLPNATLFSKKILEPSVGMTESVTTVSAAVGAVHLQQFSGPRARSVLCVLRIALSWITLVISVSTENLDHKTGWTQENLFSAGLLVVVIAVDLMSGMLFGTILVTVSLLLGSVIKYVSGSIPQVDGTTFVSALSLFFYFNHFSGLCAVLGAIHSYLGLSSQTYLVLIAALLLVAKYRNGGRWLDDVFPLAVCAAVLCVLWRILFALAMAIHLDSWLSFQTVSDLTGAYLTIDMCLSGHKSLIDSIINSTERWLKFHGFF